MVDTNHRLTASYRTHSAQTLMNVQGQDAKGSCDANFSCAYARNIAWATSTAPMPSPGRVRPALRGL